MYQDEILAIAIDERTVQQIDECKQKVLEDKFGLRLGNKTAANIPFWKVMNEVGGKYDLTNMEITQWDTGQTNKEKDTEITKYAQEKVG